MGNARIIHIEEIVFKGNTKKQNLFDRKISNNTTINHATIIRTEDDDIYGGELKDGKPHGKGILKYYHNGKAEGKYVGTFKDGKRDGEGKWQIRECSYEGEWKLDKFHGKGIYQYLDEVKQGYWFMGRFKHYLDEAADPCNYIEIIK